MPRPFLDLQVNGYAGVDFNRIGLTAEEVGHASDLLLAHGAMGVLATVITDDIDAMCAKLAALARHRRDPILGIHIEGPFLSPEPGFIGAHPAEHAIPADLDVMKRLLDAAGGLACLVTLAPERDPRGTVTRYLTEQGILVSAGHCDPTLDQLRAAMDHGLSMFTHLGNGCPAVLHRHDNIIQRVLSLREQLTICYIADGVHVPTPALGNYLRLSGADRSIVVTDAMSAAGLGPGRYPLGDQTVDVGEDGIVWSADRSHFVGSAFTMPRMVDVLRKELGLREEEIDRLVFLNPRRILGL